MVSTHGAQAAYPPAELDRRFYAFSLDRILAWGLFAAVTYLAWVSLLDDGAVLAGILLVLGTVLAVSLLYAVLLGVAGLSPGKALVGLRVVRHDDGRPIGFGPALVRTLVLGIFAIPTFGLGIATLAWTAVMDPGGWRRGAHDRMTNAVVVDVRPVAEEVAEEDHVPRQVVNLTAMRLMPAPPPGAVTVPPRASEAPVRTRPSGPPTPAPPAPAARPSPTPPPVPPIAAVPAPTGSTTPGPPGPARPAPAAPVPAPSRPRPAVPEQAPPTAVWRVSFDTGETFRVEGLAIVGRGPEARAGEDVRHLVPLRSSDMSLSKTHAQFQVVPDGTLVVMDRGSTNGSTVVRGGVSKALGAGRPATLLDGDTVRFGDRTMTVARG